MEDPEAVVSPGGVGFDINCGVRLIRTNLSLEDVEPVKEALAQSLFDHIPVGVGSQGIIPTTARDLEDVLEMGIDWSLRWGAGRPQSTGRSRATLMVQEAALEASLYSVSGLFYSCLHDYFCCMT